jgi:hypothetical protein
MLFNWYVDVDTWNKTRYAFFIRPVGNTISTSECACVLGLVPVVFMCPSVP